MDEAEIYVRDHLLIQFMRMHLLNNSVVYASDVENDYDKWIEWLKEMEENH